jgi:membrane-associated protease RseP (regulator of RpoE activity)
LPRAQPQAGRGAHCRRHRRQGPGQAAGIEAGDVIIKFDGKDIKEMRDLPRIVADTPVGRDVEVVIVRKGKEEKKTVKLGRLDDEKPVKASATPASGRRQVGGAEVAWPAAVQHERRVAQEVQDQGRGQRRGHHRR